MQPMLIRLCAAGIAFLAGEVNRSLERRTDGHGCLHWFAGLSGVASMGEA
jgi:hypothetical protein